MNQAINFFYVFPFSLIFLGSYTNSCINLLNIWKGE